MAEVASVVEHEPGAGEKTIERRSQTQPLRLFCGWFCPFAQRAWIAAEEKGVPYQYVPIMPYKADATKPGGYSKNPLSLDEKREKYPDFMKCTPKGLVPAFEYTKPDGVVDRIYESLVCVDYVEEAFPDGNPLYPKDPAVRARMRVWMTYVGEKVIPHFYRMLMKETAEERQQEIQNLLDGLKGFAEAMDPITPSGGAFFLGDTFSAADIAMCPWWRRFYSIGQVYRGLEIPREAPFDRLHAWGDACDARPSVANTIVNQERLTANYSGYADGTATSTVAQTLVKNA
mmetsp:Transcript_29877/g.54414  ORF Transcript_29877/g.54414 Transcript_29877/m.54414 type:complete len:287 (+) Transcript_29877:57-917(+)